MVFYSRFILQQPLMSRTTAVQMLSVIPKKSFFRETCDHTHDKSCPSCEQLKCTITEIKCTLSGGQLPDEDRDDLAYSFQQALKAIELWKSHQLRSIQQDKAWTSLLDATSVLITQDWAIKFPPRKYRETQVDWFAKRGISWHISVVVRRLENRLQHQAFINIVENCSQDSDSVVNIMRHTLQGLKKAQRFKLPFSVRTMPDVTIVSPC